jgi:uncharacterized protein (TIGR03545 family)
MRWKWILPRLLLVLMIWAFLRYGLDPALRYGLVSGLQSATGARVDVASLRTGFFPPTVTIEGTAVASPRRLGRNLFEFERLHVQLEPDSLSRRRFVVESGEIQNLRFDTNRGDDGRLAPGEVSESSEPSWMQEQLKEVSDQWLHQLAEQARAQLDPNTFETWRLGSGMFDKWDSRFRNLADRGRSLEPRAMAVKEGFELLKRLEPLEQIERGLQLAQEVDVIVREAEQIQRELQSIAPEVKLDYEELNAARLRDQEMIRHKLTLLKPDGRRISQTLLGPAMYRRVQQVLTWVQAIQEYRKELASQVRPPRMEGRVFPVIETRPAPVFLLKHLALSGTISIDEEQVPYAAALRDVTEQPKLLGRPSMFELRADGSRPLMLAMTIDATGDELRSEVEATYRDHEGLPVAAGKRGEVWFEGGLRNMDWSLKMKLGGEQLQGFVSLKSDIEGLTFSASEDVRSEIVEAANEALGAVRKFDAVAAFTGTLRKPEINLSSGIGEQISQGVRQAFLTQLENARTRLLQELDERAAEQLAKLKARCSKEYQELIADNGKLLEQVQEVRTVLTSLQSGKLDAGMLVRQASQSKLLREKDRAKLEQVDRVLTEFEGAMQGRIPQALIQKLPIPAEALQTGVPTLTIPGFLPGFLPGLLPQTAAEMAGGSATSGSSPALPGPVQASQPALPTRVEDLLPMALPGLLPGLFPALNPAIHEGKVNGGEGASAQGSSAEKTSPGEAVSGGAAAGAKSRPAAGPQLLPFFRPRSKR